MYICLNCAGSSETPQFTSRRCIIMLILLFGFFMFQFYSASIVGSLLLEKPRTIKTLRNLIDSPLKLGIEDIVYNKNFFRVSTWIEAIHIHTLIDDTFQVHKNTHTDTPAADQINSMDFLLSPTENVNESESASTEISLFFPVSKRYTLGYTSHLIKSMYMLPHNLHLVSCCASQWEKALQQF